MPSRIACTMSVRRAPGCGSTANPSSAKERGREIEPAQRLFDDRRREKQPLHERASETERRAKRAAQSRRVEARAHTLDQIGSAGNISAAGRKRTAEIFDQRTHHQIGAHMRWFARFDEFAVAVIDEHGRSRRSLRARKQRCARST